ncbi:MAG: toll/interleukin-1 receptor domain-containing protein [Acidobacteria bacterium]|nr:toll/interleukin-1 receptor domain-containing protein [Acidobacteriota bacterium]
MKPLNPKYVRPLGTAQNHFLEVLVRKFELSRKGVGALLKLSFNMDIPACWNRSGREYVRNSIPNFAAKSLEYQMILDEILMEQTRDSFVFDDPDFVFRWASAGALPVIHLEKEDYYCFFYREIFPIGWNIANGACDTFQELLNPLQTLERELCEELIILDPKRQDWYVLEPGNRGSSGRPELEAVRLIVDQLQKRRLWDIRKGLKQIELPLKWFSGPDAVSLRGPEGPELISDCYLNINGTDFGIELDRIVKISVGDDVIICDGEISDQRLLNRLVGLLKIQRLNGNLNETSFIPDYFFHNGIRYPGFEFEPVISDNFLTDIAGLRSREEVEQYKKTQTKYDLCPVTRRIVKRCPNTQIIPRQEEGQSEVFICFGGTDGNLAEHVAHYLTKNCGKKVFFYPEMQTDWMFHRAIDQALENCKCLVAVASARENLTRPWPEYEYRAFNVDIHSGKKPAGRLLSFIMGMDKNEVPLPLRIGNIVEAGTEGKNMEAALQELARYIG